MITVTPEMMSLIKRDIGYISRHALDVSISHTGEMETFYGEDIRVDPYLIETAKSHYICSSMNSKHLESIWNTFLNSLHFFYCPDCEIMLFLPEGADISEYKTVTCPHVVKELQPDIGLHFFDIKTVMMGRLSMLEVSRADLTVVLI